MRRDAGFTLLETLVALAVLGIVLATLFRLAGDTLVRYESREARLRLALTAEAAFDLARLQGDSTTAGGWPADLVVTVQRQELAAAVAGGAADLPTAVVDPNLDWLVVSVTDSAGRRFELGGAVARQGS